MDESFPNHHRQFIGMDNSYPTLAQLHSGGQAEPPRFLGVPRHPFYDSSSSGRSPQGFISQNRIEHATHATAATVDDSSYTKASKPGLAPRKKYMHYVQPITGQALKDRRRQAQDRIAQGRWKPDIAKAAIEYAQKTAWYDLSGRVWGVRSFSYQVEELGELCSDWKAIQEFLDKNIHRFIAFEAMERDFEVPDFLVRKANQRRSDGTLKYRWFRSFIREYQGRGKTTVESLVQVYKDKSDGLIAGESVVAPSLVHQGGSSGGAIATTPGTMALHSSLDYRAKVLSNQTFQMILDERTDGKKRQRTFDETADIEIGESTKKIKRESTEEGFMESRDKTKDPGTCEVVPDEIDDGKARMHVKGRTLTVLFHGMRDDGGDESEHVQVYVPRTSKGVTINFL